MDKKYYYVTTPIYYVNAKPHIGSAYTTIAADTLARFKRLDGYEVKFLTGTDEHGQKIEQVAKNKGISSREYVDIAHKDFILMNEVFNFSNNDFIRTTNDKHKQSVQSLWKTLNNNNAIYKGVYSGWYSIRDEAFYQKSELIDGKAPTGSEVSFIEEPCYYFKLSEWQNQLLDYYEKNPEFIAPKSRMNEVVSFVKSGLKDLCISRSTFSWGVPVPNDEKHIMYVWIDALPNYISYLGYPDRTQEFKQYWDNSVHIIGKDILRFHAIYWPAILMASDIQPPKRIFSHGWWTNEGQKISKSTGNVIDPVELSKQYGTDQLRYFLLSEITFGRDADFSYTALERRINADLANDFGNLIQRTLSFVYKNLEGTLPTKGILLSQDTDILNKAKLMIAKIRVHADNQALNKICEEIWYVISLANKYIDQEQPWSLRKTDIKRMNTVLYVLLELIRHIAILAQAVIPKGAGKALDQLGITMNDRLISALNKDFVGGNKIEKPIGIFPRIDNN